MNVDERTAQIIDHERRIAALEFEFGKRGRMTIMEAALASLREPVDEILLAQRVAAGVKATLDEHAGAGFTRWQKLGIAAAIATSVGSFLLAVAQAWPS